MTSKQISLSWYLYMLFVSALGGISLYYYVGPARWLGDAQIALMGVQYSLLSMAGMMTPPLVLGYWLRDKVPPSIPAAIEGALKHPWLRSLRRAWIILGGWLLLGTTTHGHVFAPQAGELSIAGAIEREDSPFYATISGTLSDQCMVERRERGTSYYYCPLDETLSTSSPISVLVAGTQGQIDAHLRALPDDKVQIHGYVTGDLPGTVAAFFERQNGRPLAPRPLLMRPNVEPESATKFYFGSLAFAIIGTAGLIWRDRPRPMPSTSA